MPPLARFEFAREWATRPKDKGSEIADLSPLIRAAHDSATVLKTRMLGERCASIPDDTLLRIYGANQMVTVCGPAGTGFAGDPYYFHRGAHPSEGSRVLVQMEFGCRAYRTWYFDG